LTQISYDILMSQLLITVFLFVFFITPKEISAQELNQFITLVNPVRISTYSTNPAASLNNQYKFIKDKNLPASWLLTFDALSNEPILSVIKSMDENQDIGIFMEVTENSAGLSGVSYNKTDSWHRSNSIFLSGYTQEDRIKLIDSVFNKFKEKMGFYPTSVGAWWIDSFSLSYMQKKYGITANLLVADQFDTDGYTVWGQYWAYPYYPSNLHTAIPGLGSNKINVVNIQWAPRDPINGYIGPSDKRSSLYSTQDYYAIGLPDSYFEELINLYAKKHSNLFGQITFGLEGDFVPETYGNSGQYAKYIKTAKKMQDNGEFEVVNMRQFSERFRNNFPENPDFEITSEDLLGGSKKTIWYQNPNYRINFLINTDSKEILLQDLQIYPENFMEPFYLSKNGQLDLYINLPYVLSGGIYPEQKFIINNVTLVSKKRSKDSLELTLSENRKIKLTAQEIIFENFSALPAALKSNPYINFSKTGNNQILKVRKKLSIGEEGYLFRDLTLEAEYLLKQKKILVTILVIILMLGLCSWIISVKVKKGRIILIFAYILLLSGLVLMYLKHSQLYFVSQSEVDGLLKLKQKDSGNILVPDSVCLQCSSRTPFPPAALASKRNYVKKISGKKVIFDDNLIEIKGNNFDKRSTIPKEAAKDYLKKLKVKYIYLTKHEDYLEKVPYSPGDMNVTRIFINSDVEIWEVKD